MCSWAGVDDKSTLSLWGSRMATGVLWSDLPWSVSSGPSLEDTGTFVHRTPKPSSGTFQEVHDINEPCRAPSSSLSCMIVTVDKIK